jgi:four helix bundle protein
MNECSFIFIGKSNENGNENGFVLGYWLLVLGYLVRFFVLRSANDEQRTKNKEPRTFSLASPMLPTISMATFKRPEDVDAYRLAVELRDHVFALIARPAVARHFRFCDQIRDSSRSAPANLSEGLGRYKPRDNARFVRNALGSLYETQSHLGEALKEKYIDEKDYQELFDLAGRAIKTSKGWHNYLVNCPVKPTSESARKPEPTSRTTNPNKGPATRKPERRRNERRTAERRKGERRKTERRTAERRTENEER